MISSYGDPITKGQVLDILSSGVVYVRGTQLKFPRQRYAPHKGPVRVSFPAPFLVGFLIA